MKKKEIVRHEKAQGSGGDIQCPPRRKGAMEQEVYLKKKNKEKGGKNHLEVHLGEATSCKMSP